MSSATVIPAYVQRHSFIELDARARAQSLMRDVLGAFPADVKRSLESR